MCNFFFKNGEELKVIFFLVEVEIADAFFHFGASIRRNNGITVHAVVFYLEERWFTVFSMLGSCALPVPKKERWVEVKSSIGANGHACPSLICSHTQVHLIFDFLNTLHFLSVCAQIRLSMHVLIYSNGRCH